jgi:DNA-binding GntR family transcriptional regulator
MEVCSVIESEATAKQESNVSAPHYQIVIDHITAGIKAGVYPPGSKLPTIIELSKLTGVGVTAVKTALLLLGERGIVRGQQGKGSYVADHPPV